VLLVRSGNDATLVNPDDHLDEIRRAADLTRRRDAQPPD
jgi:hypothetical protein